MRLIGRIACGDEVVAAFVWSVEVADVADGAPEGVDGSGADAPEMCFQFGEGHFDRVQVGAVGRQEEEPGAALPRMAAAFALLCAARLSRMTTSPFSSVGASCVST